MIKFIKPKGQRYFMRAKSKETGKYEYVGYIPKSWLWHRIHATSWLLRFGGYSEVRYYNPKNKKLIDKWDIKKHDNYCLGQHYNDTVWRDGDYFVMSEELEKRIVEERNAK